MCYDLFGRQIGREDEVGLLINKAAAHSAKEPATGAVEHDIFVGSHSTALDSLGECSHRYAGSWQQFVALEVAILHEPVHDLLVGRQETVAVALDERVVQSADDAIGRFAVGEHLGEDGFGLTATFLGREVNELARTGFPGVVHEREGFVLGNIDAHIVLAEPSVSLKAAGVLISGNCTCSRTDGLEVRVGDSSRSLNEGEHGCAHSVAAGNVLRSALEEEVRVLGKFLAKGDGIVVVAAMGDGDEFDAVVQRLMEPQIMQAVLGYADDDRDAVVGADLRKGARGVAGRLHDKYALFIFIHAREHAIRLGFLERAGGHLRADLRIPAGEGDVQILQAEELGEFDGLIGYRRTTVLECALDRHPLGITVDAVEVFANGELAVGVLGTDERGFASGRVAECPAPVIETVVVSHVYEFVGCGSKFHICDI